MSESVDGGDFSSGNLIFFNSFGNRETKDWMYASSLSEINKGKEK